MKCSASLIKNPKKRSALAVINNCFCVSILGCSVGHKSIGFSSLLQRIPSDSGVETLAPPHCCTRFYQYLIRVCAVAVATSLAKLCPMAKL